MMLRQFEDHIGAPLFATARKSRLTPLGEQVYNEARRELDHFDRTVSAIKGLSRAEMGFVRVAATPSVATALLPPILHAFLCAHPNLQLDMRDMTSAAVQQELERDRADVGIASIGPVPGLDRHRLFSDPFGVVCRADHRMAKDWSDLTWADLVGEDFIANGLCAQISDPGFRPVLEASRLSVPNTASLLGLVRAGVGISLLPKLAVPPEYTDIVFLPLKDIEARREVWLVTQPRQMLTPAARAFVKAVRGADIPKRHGVWA